MAMVDYKGKSGQVLEFVEYLRETLIPDLQDAGKYFTALDFVRAADYLHDYALMLAKEGK